MLERLAGKGARTVILDDPPSGVATWHGQTSRSAF
jgi:hypothetical protein